MECMPCLCALSNERGKLPQAKRVLFIDPRVCMSCVLDGRRCPSVVCVCGYTAPLCWQEPTTCTDWRMNGVPHRSRLHSVCVSLSEREKVAATCLIDRLCGHSFLPHSLGGYMRVRVGWVHRPFASEGTASIEGRWLCSQGVDRLARVPNPTS